MVSDIKEYLDELYEDIEEKVLWEEADQAEPLIKPKSYFDVIMKAAQNYDEEKAHEAFVKLKEECKQKIQKPETLD